MAENLQDTSGVSKRQRMTHLIGQIAEWRAVDLQQNVTLLQTCVVRRAVRKHALHAYDTALRVAVTVDTAQDAEAEAIRRACDVNTVRVTCVTKRLDIYPAIVKISIFCVGVQCTVSLYM